MVDEGKEILLTEAGDDFLADEDTLPSGDGGDSKGKPSELEIGSHAGRYVILDQIGQGGMGVVYMAYDPELDRRIALKLLSVKKSSASQADRARERLLREAKALAQLSHPNVVSAYDVGTLDQDVFVAMELVEGLTLKEWIREKKPTLWQRVQVLLAAGRGIDAAHQAGLVHRDVKPDNIIVGDDGRVRVLDFGLARAAVTESEIKGPAKRAEKTESRETKRPDLSLSGEISTGGSFLNTPVTRAGVIVGTPGYMAPEQYLGVAVDEQSDQYSFCITLYEALYGRRPFVAKRIKKLKKKVLEGKLDPAPSNARVPSRLRRIALRGISVSKEDRYSSMGVLLAELGRDPRVLRRRLSALAAVVLLVAASFTGAYAWQAEKLKLCAGADSHLAGVWDKSLRAQVKKSFVATGRPHALDTYQRLGKVLDQRSEEWVVMCTEACEATHVRGEQSDALLDKRMACLQRRLSEMQALVVLFAQEADAKIVDKAVSAAYGLSGISACADLETLMAAYPPPDDPAVFAQVEKFRSQLDKARALQKSGKYREGIEIVKQVAGALSANDYAPLHAETLFALGDLQSFVGEAQASEESLYGSIDQAARAKDSKLRARAMAALIYVVGTQLQRPAEGLAIGRLAQADVIGAGNDPLIEASVLSELGNIRTHKGEYQAARADFLRAIAVVESAFGADHLKISVIRNSLAQVLFDQGEYEPARKQMERVLAIQERALGPDHPMVAQTLGNLGIVLVSLGQTEQARQYNERSLSIKEKILGPEHPSLAFTLSNLGDAYLTMGQVQKAVPFFQRALAIWEKKLGAQHRLLAHPLAGLGRCALTRGEPAVALPLLERALALRKAHPGSPSALGMTRFALAQALWAAKKDRRRALALAKHAQADYQKAGQHQQQNLQAVENWLAQHSANSDTR